MKIVLYTLLFCTSFCVGQTENVTIKSLRIPQSPALTLLDKSFSATEITTSSNEINANLVNIKDNTVEITPYWLMTNKTNFNMKEYYGVWYDEANKLKQNSFSNLKKVSISLAYAPSDTLTSIALGIRSNIINIKNLKKIKSNNEEYKKYNLDRIAYKEGKDSGETKTRFQKEMEIAGTTPDAATLKLINAYDNALDANGKPNKENKAKIIDNIQNNYNQPIFSLDVAAGASTFFKDSQLLITAM